MEKTIDEIIGLMKGSTTRPLDTVVPGLMMIKGDVPSHQLAAVYKPMIGFVVQGSKTLSIGREKIIAQAPSYFLLPMHVPATATVRSASDGLPYMSLGLDLEQELLQALLRDVAHDALPNPRRSWQLANWTSNMQMRG